jgi:hypothetical protein
MKLEVGKTYVLFNGEVKECALFNTATDDDDFFSAYGRFMLGNLYHHEDGTFSDGSSIRNNVSHEYKEEATVEYKTFGEMTDEEKGALLLAQYEGKTIEYCDMFNNWGSRRETKAGLVPTGTYRVRVEPVITTASRYLDSVGGERYSVSYTLVDGVPDCSTVTMDKSDTT